MMNINMSTILDQDSPYRMVAPALAAFVLSAYIVKRMQQQRNEKAKPWKMIPGRKPIIGHAGHVPSQSLVVSVFERWADQYGKETGCFQVDMMGNKFVIVCTEERMNEIFKHRPKVVQRSANIRSAMRSVGGNGLFEAEGEQWRQEHRLVTAALNKKNVQDYLVVFKDMVRKLSEKWDQESAVGKTVRADIDLGSISSESIAKVAMGKDYDFLNNPTGIPQDIQNLMKGMVDRSSKPVSYWKIPFIGQYLDGLASSIDAVLKTTMDVINEHKENRKDCKNDNMKTYVNKLLDAMESEKSQLSNERMIGNVITLFLAGTDTTSKALSTAFYLLANDQELQAELRSEADGFDVETATLHDFFTALPRIKSFLHEVHRCYGVPGMPFINTADIPLAGSTLPKGTEILVLTHYINTSANARIPKGPSNTPVTEFCPRRWLVPTENDGNDNGDKNEGEYTCPGPNFKDNSFYPFGHGVRSCPGKLYSEALSFVILAATLQTFVWALAPAENPKSRFINDVMLVPEGGVRITMKKRRP